MLSLIVEYGRPAVCPGIITIIIIIIIDILAAQSIIVRHVASRCLSGILKFVQVLSYWAHESWLDESWLCGVYSAMLPSPYASYSFIIRRIVLSLCCAVEITHGLSVFALMFVVCRCCPALQRTLSSFFFFFFSIPRPQSGSSVAQPQVSSSSPEEEKIVLPTIADLLLWLTSGQSTSQDHSYCRGHYYSKTLPDSWLWTIPRRSSWRTQGCLSMNGSADTRVTGNLRINKFAIADASE